MAEKKRVGILTGGGDAPGLNAVIYGALLRAYEAGNIELVGIKKGWKLFDMPKEKMTPEMIQKFLVPLDIAELDDLQVKGGTILYSTRTNPFKDVLKLKEEAEREKLREKIGKDLADKMKILNLEALIAIGGDDTLGVSAAMFKYGNSKVVGCPKTIDNDLAGTDFTFGFFSGAQLASNSLEALTTTAKSHQRIFVVEVMGRDAGWLTLYSGLSAGSDVILIPETPFDMEKDVVNLLKERVKAGYDYHIIACSEGAYPQQKSLETHFKTISKETIDKLPKDAFGNPNLASLNIASVIEKELALRDDLKKFFSKYDCEYEVRSVVLGHTMRAGHPNVYDRVLGLRYGWHAMGYVLEGNYGKMTSLQGSEIVPIDLVKGATKKLIKPNSDIVAIRDAMCHVKHKAKKKLDL
ncbi:MAG: ATP-dependent 6-phosphofructokinase [Candidatus Lokiarchaeota archaeon]|nr:ATP-dependent 6-phosphofructokinase [Candidatus Lokiarchaeota archaeon]